MLIRESIGADDSPHAVAPHLQRPSMGDVDDWQAQHVKRMENLNPNQPLPVTPNTLNPQPAQQLNPADIAMDENQGVPGVNLPCGWLDGRQNPDGEAGVDSEPFRLGPGRYILHIRWTRTPVLAGIEANMNLIDIEQYDEQEEWDSAFFPGTRMPQTVVVEPSRHRSFFVDLRRNWVDEGLTPTPGNLVNDAAIIWWFERERDGATAGGGTGRLPLSPVDLGVETPRQRAWLHP
ncbi:hypothetical protein MMC26_002237 [Xylographa opegraphella]|nr:hypothetical protein [Xylographa opegraphella]